MRVFYPYNEILPTGRAHDAYVVQNCASLGAKLAVGRGSLKEEALAEHYDVDGIELEMLPILRKNNPFGVNWNRPFFWACQRKIKKERPDLVITSVLKQGAYHHSRKVDGVRYVFELHELQWDPIEKKKGRLFDLEKEMLGRADLVVVTTSSLKRILRGAPYNLKVPIEVVPLAVPNSPLPKKTSAGQTTAAYVGQLYPMQGVELLIDGLPEGTHLKVIGGTKEDVDRLKAHAKNKAVTFYGFQPPKQIPELLADVDLFLMPSRNLQAKPHVAHTKLIQYANWGRTTLVPDLQAVREQLPATKGLRFYKAGCAQSLAEAISACPKGNHDEGQHTWCRRAANYTKLLKTLTA